MEPTFKQHKILEALKNNGGEEKKSESEDLEIYWELVRAGYLKNLLVLNGGWLFLLTEKAKDYLSMI